MPLFVWLSYRSLMTDEELMRRLFDSEDGWTERKQANQTDEIRKTLVAFANSLPDGEQAVLYIGMNDSGKVIGLENPDETQKRITKSAREWCYPPISINSRVLLVEGKQVLAVIIDFSHNRPHFAGPAFIRVGSQSLAASSERFEELIASRVSKARPILQAKREGQLVSVAYYPLGFEDLSMRSVIGDCTVTECTPLLASFQSIKTREILSAEYHHMKISRTPDGKQLRIDIAG